MGGGFLAIQRAWLGVLRKCLAFAKAETGGTSPQSSTYFSIDCQDEQLHLLLE